MNSTQVARDHVKDLTVSTIYVEPFDYYETAVCVDGTDQWDVVHGNEGSHARAMRYHEAWTQYAALGYVAGPRGAVMMEGEQRVTTERTKWNTQELQEDFEVIGFLAPYVVVVRKSDRQKGSLEFSHRPRVYFGWQPYEP